jgi:phosphoglycolate phosphatase-like HAD superfamily hydrolase
MTPAQSQPAPLLILFDLVSTITDAGPRYAQAYLDVAAQYKLALPAPRDILNELGQRTLGEIIKIHSPDLPADKIPDFMNDCNHACDTMLERADWVEELYPDVRATLQALAAQNRKIGLYTGTRREAAEDQLRYHALQDIFPPAMVRAKDNVADAAKDSQTIKTEQVASLIRDNPAPRVIVIGDSISDYHAAQASNAEFIGFANTQKNIFRFAAAGVQNVFTRYDRLPGLINVITAPVQKAAQPLMKR